MNVIPLVEAHLQSAELMHQGLGLLDYPAHDSQPAAMLGDSSAPGPKPYSPPVLIP
jgi:hypothetical protein